MVTLIPFVIVLIGILYLLRLMTRKVKLYERGFKIDGIGRKEYFYDDAREIMQSYEGQRIHFKGTDSFVIKRLAYVFNLNNGSHIILKKRNYVYLKSKMDDLLQNLIVPQNTSKEENDGNDDPI
jgi:hypothetical protein